MFRKRKLRWEGWHTGLLAQTYVQGFQSAFYIGQRGAKRGTADWT
ncbi:MAG TPA: hypothetical protein VGD64_16580 [Acidisarcina sp.]